MHQVRQQFETDLTVIHHEQCSPYTACTFAEDGNGYVVILYVRSGKTWRGISTVGNATLRVALKEWTEIIRTRKEG
jgi:hypothetical protein